MGLEELTIYQKIAIEGQVADILKNATGDACVLSKLYYLAKEIPTDIGVYFIEAAREMLNLPEDKVNRALFEISIDEFPEWLWLDKVIEDIKVAYFNCHSDQIPVKVSIDKKAMKESIVKSAFVRFLRNASIISKEMAMKACNRIIEEKDFPFLTPVCVALMQDIAILPDHKDVKTSDLDALFNLEIDCKMGLLSYMDETKVLDRLKLLEENPAQFVREVEEEKRSMEEIGPTIITFSKDGGNIRVKQFNREWKDAEGKQKVVEKLQHQMGEILGNIKQEEVSYTVSKLFKGHPQASVLREFKTQEEAKAFVKNMEAQFPELLDTCKFIISENRIKRTEDGTSK